MENQSIISDMSYQTAYEEYGDNLRIAAVSQFPDPSRRPPVLPFSESLFTKRNELTLGRYTCRSSR